MALNSGNNNNQNNYSIQTYSRYKFSNTQSSLEDTCLHHTYWNHTLKIGISPKLQSNDDTISWDHKNAVYIYLNHTKAHILALEIAKFLQNPEGYKSMGVNSGNGIIYISNGSEFGKTNPFLVIAKVDDQGSLVSQIAYEFKVDYHYAVRNFNAEKFDFEKSYYNNIEIEEIGILLEEYYKSMTMAGAYAVREELQYDINTLKGAQRKIAEKLGVDLGTGRSNNYNKSSNSAFNNKSNGGNSTSQSSYSSTDIDEIEGMM